MHNSKPDFDKAVMKEIFPALLDSIYTEITFSMTPPLITEVTDSVTGKTELQPAEKGPADRELIRNALSAFEQHPNPVLIVLSDSVHGLFEDDLAFFRSGHALSGDTASPPYYQKNYLLPLGDLTARNCFRLTRYSEYKEPPGDAVMFARTLKVISFSRIIFDTDKVNGMLTCEYVCGGLCGNGYRIYVEKKGEKWTIKRIEHTWIS